MSTNTTKRNILGLTGWLIVGVVLSVASCNKRSVGPTTVQPGPAPAPAGTFPLSLEIGNLHLGDVLLASFRRDWQGPGEKPWGSFFDPKMFSGTPITDLWDSGIIHIEADPGREYLGEYFKLGELDLAQYRESTLAIRCKYSDRMYRQFKVELKRKDGTATIWIVDLDDEEIAAFRERGFGDMLLPLNEANDLTGITELVLVFEGNRVKTVAGKGTAGEIKLHSIRITAPPASTLPVADQIDEFSRRAFEWFEHYRNEHTGLVPDRAPNRLTMGITQRRRLICSIASVGYYLSIIPDAVDTGRLTEDDARQRVLTVLHFLENNADHHNGLLYHFIRMDTGKAVSKDVEVSALDSAILFNGCMIASNRFGGEVAEVADRLIARANWSAFLRKATNGKPALLSMGWKSDAGLLGPMDVRSAEFLMPYLLAVGAETNSIDPQIWWNTKVVKGTIAGREILNAPSHGLFTSYYGLGWCNLEGRVDRDGIDLWENARLSALSNRDFSRDEKSSTYAAKWGGWWGISAGDSPQGYVAPGTIKSDAGGTVWPIPALAAFPWARRELDADLAQWQSSPPWAYVNGPFGLAPFNVDEKWIGEDLIGIDLGSMCLHIQNQRRGTAWRLWRDHPVAKRAMSKLYPTQ